MKRTTETTNIVAILTDGRQLKAGPFATSLEIGAAITRWHERHGDALRTVASIMSQTWGGTLCDFSVTHYTQGELVEVVEQYRRTQMPAGELSKPFEGTVHRADGRAVRVTVPSK